MNIMNLEGKKEGEPFALDKKKRKYIVKLLKNRKSKTCFEWGCGLSTKYFLSKCSDIERWISIENNIDWYNYLKEQIDFSTWEIIYVPSSVEKPKKYWWEMENESPQKLVDYFYEYIHGIDGIHPDFIFIDGRARLQCLEIAYKWMKDDGVIVMDDSHRISRNLEDWSSILKKLKRKKIDKRLSIFMKII